LVPSAHDKRKARLCYGETFQFLCQLTRLGNLYRNNINSVQIALLKTFT